MRRLSVCTLVGLTVAGTAPVAPLDPSPTGPTTGPVTPPDVDPWAGTPPQSTVPNRYAYAWISDGTTAAIGTQYTSTNPAATVTAQRSGVGSYAVTFAGLIATLDGPAGTSGIGHVQAYGSSSNYCTVSNLQFSVPHADVTIRLRCFTAGGAPADSPFVASYTSGSMGSARFGYVLLNSADPPGAIPPHPSYTYDSVDSDGVAVTHPATGRYTVVMPSFGPDAPAGATVLVSALYGAVRCQQAGLSPATHEIGVRCYDPAGAPADTEFMLTYAQDASFTGRTDRPYAHFRSGQPNVQRASAGNYFAVLSGLGQNQGQAVVGATDTPGAHCHVGYWEADLGDLWVNVLCFNAAGAPTDASFAGSVVL